jgi:hypothetical protein
MHIFGIISIILLPVFLLRPLFAFRRSCNPSMGERILTKVRVNSAPLNSLVLQCSLYEIFAYCNSLLLELWGKLQRGCRSVYSTIYGTSLFVYRVIQNEKVNIFGGDNVSHSFIHSFIRSFIHSFIHSSVHSFI